MSAKIVVIAVAMLTVGSCDSCSSPDRSACFETPIVVPNATDGGADPTGCGACPATRADGNTLLRCNAIMGDGGTSMLECFYQELCGA